MTIQEIMLSKKISQYRLSKNSGIPYTTINDIYSGKAQLEKCSAETIYKIAIELGVSMEELIAPCFDKRNDFELYKSNVCHQLKELGDIDFIISIIESDDIRKYNKYISELKKLVLNPEIIKKQASSLKIVYTPLHGTGNVPVRMILNELGFENVYIVPEQELPDGNFPTVPYPNPEDKKAFKMALELAKKIDADIVLATDPDADRLGVYAKDNKTGNYVSFTGNMSGMLVCEYQLEQRKQKGILPRNGAVVTTIVSGKMAKAVAREYNVALIETLTGFKYIGEQIKLFKKTNSNEFLFGFEESYGCLVGTHSRDKDAVAAVMALCEAAAYYKDEGLTLWDQMINLYEKYGYYTEELYTVTLKGIDGVEKIQSIMQNIRNNPPKHIGTYKVINFYDYKKDTELDYITGTKTTTGLPESDVLYFEMENETWCCVRPSGTEPKIKLYMGIKGKTQADASEKIKILTSNVKQLLGV